MEVVNHVLFTVVRVLIVFYFWFTRLGCECDGSEMEVMRRVVVTTALRWVWWLRQICDGCGGDERIGLSSSVSELFVLGVSPFSFSMEPLWSVNTFVQSFS
ncbi:hypothetical protein QL285_005823 [Trifolium repens]|nr:hypothetical protein QL285_005823 [Trifolium repens]